MEDKELMSITGKFQDIKPLLEDKKKFLRQAQQNRRRLKTKFDEYSFLKDLVGINSNDDLLDQAFKKYLNAFGFQRVDVIGKTFREEDMRLWVDNKLIIFEATGTKGQQPEQGKQHQIVKHVAIRKTRYPLLEVHPVFIANHNNKVHYLQRHKKPYDDIAHKMAIGFNLCITTTIDLLNAFIKFKNGEFSANDLVANFCTPGIFKVM